MVGPLVYEVETANELVAMLEKTFEGIDALRGQMRTAKIKLTAIEMIWGKDVNDSSCPDHEEGASLVRQLKTLQEQIQQLLAELAERSVAVKDVDEGLVDVFHVRDGHLVHLCWKRGEPAFDHWHHVDSGFAGREPI